MTAVVLSIAVVILKRLFIFIYSIILSPFGVLGLGLPKGAGGIFAPFASFASEWWKRLLQTAFFLPIYILLIIVLVNLSVTISAALTDTVDAKNALQCGGAEIAAGFLGIIILIVSLLVLSDWFKKNAPLVPPKGGVGGFIGARVGQGLGAAGIAAKWAGRETRRTGGQAAKVAKWADNKAGGHIGDAAGSINSGIQGGLQTIGKNKAVKAASWAGGLAGRSIKNVGGATLGALGGARGVADKATSLQGSEGWIPPAKSKPKPEPKPDPKPKSKIKYDNGIDYDMGGDS